MARGRISASRTAARVTSWNAARRTGRPPIASRASSQSSTCQAMASPSRSGSVASTSSSALPSARAIAPSVLCAPLPASKAIAKPSPGSTEPAFAGRSRRWPRVAIALEEGPSQPPMVLAFAGDSTTTT